MVNLVSKSEFLSHFPVVKQALLAFYSPKVNPIALRSSIQYINRLVDYNVPHGKLNRGLTLVHAYQLLNDNISESQLNSAFKLGWAVEVLQTCFLIADDIIDHSITRRGQPCWYKQEGIGLNAVNDAMFLENATEIMIRDALHGSACSDQVLKLFSEVKLMTIFGQQLDSRSFDIENCTEENYIEITRCKTSYYTFVLPILAAMRMSLATEEYDAELRTLCYAMGFYFQAQDDFLDCFGDPNVTGKVGTDIEDGKCTWLLVQALKALQNDCNNCQFQKIKNCYNKPNHVDAVKNAYVTLGLKVKYSEFENEQVKHLIGLIENLSIQRLQPLFHNLLHVLHGRSR